MPCGIAFNRLSMDVKILSEILGHKSPTIILNRYVHSLMEHKKDMMNRLGKLL
jgi:integrase